MEIICIANKFWSQDLGLTDCMSYACFQILLQLASKQGTEQPGQVGNILGFLPAFTLPTSVSLNKILDSSTLSFIIYKNRVIM